MKWFKRFQTYLEQSVRTTNHDESVLEQPKHWMQSITWALIGTSTFAVGWLAIAQTEEIVVATGKLEPIGAVKDIQMPLGGIADKILVREGDRVSADVWLKEITPEGVIMHFRSYDFFMNAH